MSRNQYLDELGQPFPYSDVHWRMQYVDTTKSEGFAVPYLDARAVEDRLDRVIGQDNWNDSYETWHTYTETVTERDRTTVKEIRSQLCTIYVYNEERGEWLGKTDGAENTDIESIKGGLSDSFKRAAVKWNVGRYMYKMDSVWVKAEKRGKSYVVADSEKERLKAEYMKVVKNVFGEKAVAALGGNTQAPTGNQQKSNNQPAQNASAPTGQRPQQQPTQTGNAQPDVYEITNIRVEGEGEKQRSKLELSKGNGKSTVFMNGADPNLKVGSRIKNLKGRTGKNSYGNYSILDSYELAA